MKYLLLITLLFPSVLLFAQSTDSTQVDSTAIYNAMKQKEAQKNTQQAPKKKNQTPFIKKIYTGGDFGMSFGSATSLRIAPLIGYKITNSFHVGTKGFYQYIKYRDLDDGQHNWGGSFWARQYLFNLIYLHLEPEWMNYQIYNSSAREHVWFLWAGAGIRKMTGKNTWVTAHVLFDLLNNKNSPYNRWEPQYSVGVGMGF